MGSGVGQGAGEAHNSRVGKRDASGFKARQLDEYADYALSSGAGQEELTAIDKHACPTNIDRSSGCFEKGSGSVCPPLRRIGHDGWARHRLDRYLRHPTYRRAAPNWRIEEYCRIRYLASIVGCSSRTQHSDADGGLAEGYRRDNRWGR